MIKKFMFTWVALSVLWSVLVFAHAENSFYSSALFEGSVVMYWVNQATVFALMGFCVYFVVQFFVHIWLFLRKESFSGHTYDVFGNSGVVSKRANFIVVFFLIFFCSQVFMGNLRLLPAHCWSLALAIISNTVLHILDSKIFISRGWGK